MLSLYDALIGNASSLVRTALVGVLAYVALVAVLRVSGKRTLSKLNAFDLVVTVALGSCLATVLLSDETSWAQGLTAFLVLIGMQYVVAWLSSYSGRVNRLVKSSPALVFYRGDFLRGAMHRERLTEDEIYAAIRSSGIAQLEDVGAVVLESDASLSVLGNTSSELGTLDPVKMPESGRPAPQG